MAGRTNIGIRAHMRILPLRRVEVVEKQAHLVVYFVKQVFLHSLVVLDFYADSVVFRLFPLRHSFYCRFFLVELVHELASIRTPALDLPRSQGVSVLIIVYAKAISNCLILDWLLLRTFFILFIRIR